MKLRVLNKQTLVAKYLTVIAGSVILLFTMPQNPPLTVPLKSEVWLTQFFLPIKALNAIRLGNNSNKRRPLRVNLPDINCVSQILKAKSKLRNIDTLKHLNIDIDKTKLQQEQFKAIWNMLSERKIRGETNIRIGYIRGQLKIISKN